MPTIAQDTCLQGSRPASSCLVILHAFQSCPAKTHYGHNRHQPSAKNPNWLANVDSDGGHKKNILDHGASPFVPAAREEQPIEDPPPQEILIPLEEIPLHELKCP